MPFFLIIRACLQELTRCRGVQFASGHEGVVDRGPAVAIVGVMAFGVYLLPELVELPLVEGPSHIVVLSSAGRRLPAFVRM